MSASAAKVSKKELNSNHDGADETSGKGNGGLLLTAIFTFFSNIICIAMGRNIPVNCCVVHFDFALHAATRVSSWPQSPLRVFTFRG